MKTELRIFSNFKWLALSLIMALSYGASAQKTIAYVTYWSGTASEIQYSKLTNIIYSFAIPDVDGKLKPLQGTAKLQQIVTNAHAVGCKVSLAIGGWSENGVTLDSRFEAIGANATYRANMVNDAVALVNQYNLDGIDMDWEYPDAGSSANNFEALMTQMYNALHPMGKLVTAAVGGGSYSGGGINATVKNVVDWLNVMCYDYNTYQHATYADAVAGCNYYISKGFAPSQVAMGVPFYGRDSWEAYSALVGRGADPYADTFSGVGYNGITTITQKANYAKTNGLAGIMIWELAQDLNNQYSLLTAIHGVLGTPSGPANVAPTAALVSPTTGSKFLNGTAITLTAAATDADGTISKVEFFDGATKLGEDLSAPYSFNWTNASTAAHSLTVKATDNNGTVTTSSAYTITLETFGSCTGLATWKTNTFYNAGQKVQYNGKAWESLVRHKNIAPVETQTTKWKLLFVCGATNALPTSAITAPVTGANVSAGGSFAIASTATDANGTITKVEYFANGVKLGEDLTSPYAYSWTNVAAGAYGIVATATDNNGFTTNSTIVNVTSTGTAPVNQNPTVSLTAPSNGATYSAPASITISANASDADGTISKVEFYQGTTLLNIDNTAPYSYSWTGVAAGSYSITAKAFDNNNASTTSTAVSVTVSTVANQLPTVSLTAPTNGATYTAPASVTISATATDADGTISKVEFYQGTTLLNSDNAAPYTFSWANVAAGTYSITAKAFDNNNATTTSTSVSITVNAATGGSCTGYNAYVEAGPYVAGSRVTNVSNLYECRPFPNSGWCTGAAWAYAPGTGVYWADAWTLVSACTGAKLAGTTSTEEVEVASAAVYPNPFENSFTINFYNANETYQITIVNDKGQLVESATVNNQTEYVAGSNLNSGVYFVSIQSSLDQSTFKLVKF